LSKADALEKLAEANREASVAEAEAADKQIARRAAVRAAFQAGCTAPEVGAVLAVSPQRVYQIRDSRIRQTG
jgi:DNA-directed RNA polymerase specialized sigma subunit